MIYLDPRAGSGDLLPLFPPNTAALRSMEFGDVAWLGSGPEGMPVQVGAEIKKLPDLLQCIGNGRFIGHQLPGLANTYNAVYLVIEGVWKRDRDGVLVVPRHGGWVPVELGRRQYMVRDLEGWITTVETMGRVRVRRTESRQATVNCILDLHHWWSDKEYDRHRSTCQFDTSQDMTPMLKPGLVRRVAAQLPGISWVRSQHVAATFESVLDMVMADPEDWAGIKWKTPDGKNQGLGMGTGRKVVSAIRGERQ